MRRLAFSAITLTFLVALSSCGEDPVIAEAENALRDLSDQIDRSLRGSFSSTLKNDQGRLLDEQQALVREINFDQIIIFNIGDASALENISSPYKQKFDQESVNYCNFDPLLLSNKNSRKLTNYRGYEFSSSSAMPDPLAAKQEDLNVNIFLKGDIFNRSSEITGIFLFFSIINL
jgi:hypothetical protein